jgi:hypothetical protein
MECEADLHDGHHAAEVDTLAAFAPGRKPLAALPSVHRDVVCET